MFTRRPPPMTRRQFLKAAALAGLGAAAPAFASASWRASTAPPRIVVVGAGLAGLTAAHRLSNKYRLPCSVYEARERPGGRVWTDRSYAGGQWAERGAQFVSSGDRALRRLIRELGLDLIDYNVTYPAGAQRLFFGGAFVTSAAMAADLEAVEEVAWSHYDEVVAPATWDTIDSATSAWDDTTVEEWLDLACPGGLSSTVALYLKTYLESEYAGPVTAMSALHAIYDFGLPAPGFDERYTVRGGNDQVATGLVDRLVPGSVHFESPLLALSRNGDGSYLLTFDAAGAPEDVEADLVVLAIPFSTLRDVDLGGLPLDPRKSAAIAGLDLGLNAKVNLEFSAPVGTPAYNGESYSDLLPGPTFPTDPGQGGTSGILTTFGCSDAAALYSAQPAHGAAAAGIVSANLAAIEQLFPGAGAAFTGKAELDFWPNDPWAKGSYSYYRAGQFGAFAGIEAAPEGLVFFAGEHTARYRHRATMNGAVESGDRVAREVRRAAKRL